MSFANHNPSPPAKESSSRSTPNADLFTGDVQVLLATTNSVTGNPTHGTILTEDGCLPRSMGKQNVTNHHAAIIQDMFHEQKISKEEITEYMFKRFPDLRGGEGVEPNERMKAVRTKVELVCSMWAPRYRMNEEEKLLSKAA